MPKPSPAPVAPIVLRRLRLRCGDWSVRALRVNRQAPRRAICPVADLASVRQQVAALSAENDRHLDLRGCRKQTGLPPSHWSPA